MFEKIVAFIRDLYHEPTGMIPLHAPVFRGKEKEYLIDCIDSTYVSSVGEYVTRFEEEVARYTGAKKAVACVNGTCALHMALKLVGVGPDTEVLTQPLTFLATSNAIAYCTADPVFLDVDRDTMGLSPVALKTWLNENAELHPIEDNQVGAFNKTTGRRISGCVPMHTFGHPCRIDEIVEVCGQYRIPVVEDAAESLGSFYKGQHTGTFGVVGILSFNGNKIITTGGGGILLFQDEDLAAKAKHLTTQAKVPHPWEFIHDQIGYNYRMPNINAALGIAQLEQLPAYVASKRCIAEDYQDFFAANAESGICFVSEPAHSISNYWLNTIIFENHSERTEFLALSNRSKVMTRPPWRLMNRLPMFKHCETGDLSNATDLTDRLVNLPSSVRS